LIRALGYDVKDEEPAKVIDRQAILGDLAKGTITPEEAAQRLAGR
jgi:hypothetical protein